MTSEVLIAERELVGLQAEAQAMLRKRKGLISATLSNYRKQRNEAEINLRGLEAERRALEGQVADLTIEAPVSGKVERLSVFTVGGFVEAGSTLMSIVPTDEDIEIESFFDNRDVGFLEPGQRAIVKFDAFPSERFGVILGKVSTVGADARGDVEAGKWVYNVRVVLDKSKMMLPGREVRFSPGMTATVDIVTGERRLISYFFEPIVRTLQDSLGER